MLDCWNAGHPTSHPNAGIHDFWDAGMLDCWNAGVLGSRTPEPWIRGCRAAPAKPDGMCQVRTPELKKILESFRSLLSGRGPLFLTALDTLADFLAACGPVLDYPVSFIYNYKS